MVMADWASLNRTSVGLKPITKHTGGRRSLARLNRTSVGLKPAPATHLHPPENWGLNRTSVGLKLQIQVRVYYDEALASIEPAWD